MALLPVAGRRVSPGGGGGGGGGARQVKGDAAVERENCEKKQQQFNPNGCMFLMYFILPGETGSFLAC